MPVLCPAVAFHPVFDTMPFYTYNKYYVNTNEYRRDMNLGYIIFTIYFLAILAVLYFIPKRRQMKQAKKNGSLTGAMGGQAAYTKEQQFLAKEQFAAYRKTVYADHPQVERFESVKKKVILFLVLSNFLLIFAKICFAGKTAGISITAFIPAFISAFLTTFGLNAIFLFCAMGPKWTMAFLLYILVLKDILSAANVLFTQLGIDSFEKFVRAYIDGFRQYPLAITLDFLSWIYMLLVLAAAIWLTLIPKNRELAKQSETLQVQLKNFTPTL